MTNVLAETVRPKQKKQTKRELTRTDYHHLDEKICRDLSRFTHHLGKDKLYHVCPSSSLQSQWRGKPHTWKRKEAS